MPTQRIWASSGDSAMVVISPKVEVPSFLDSVMSAPFTPRSREAKSRLPPTYTVDGSWAETRLGDTQSQRYSSSPGGGEGAMAMMSPVSVSTRV